MSLKTRLLGGTTLITLAEGLILPTGLGGWEAGRRGGKEAGREAGRQRGRERGSEKERERERGVDSKSVRQRRKQM